MKPNRGNTGSERMIHLVLQYDHIGMVRIMNVFFKEEEAKAYKAKCNKDMSIQFKFNNNYGKIKGKITVDQYYYVIENYYL